VTHGVSPETKHPCGCSLEGIFVLVSRASSLEKTYRRHLPELKHIDEFFMIQRRRITEA
jgi:hypothetical protein